LVEYAFAPSDANGGVSSIRSALISQPSQCDACHPDCFDAVDAPVASDLNSSNSTSIDYDSTQGGIRAHILVNAAQRGAVNATAVCGNGILENGINGGVEQCDDGNTRALDGCDTLCRLETTQNWICPTAGQACRVATCGNGIKEGSEGCDDGDDVVGDGCGPDCTIEPSCAVGQPCVSSCGDGIKLPADTTEQCDDGNTLAGDGCSATCTIESGFSCSPVGGTLPSSFPLTVTYRDFIRAVANGSSIHPDFETYSGSAATLGMVGSTLSSGKPTYTGVCEKNKTPFPASPTCGGGTQAQTTSSSRFAQWYADTEIANVMKKVVTTITMNRQGTTSVYKNSTFGQQLQPLNGLGWVATSPQKEAPYLLNGVNVNFGFTTEMHYWFKFQGGEVLTFSGDDDVWVFIAGKLALDLGGLHSKLDRTISINSAGVVSCYVGTSASGTSCGTTNLSLTAGNVYEVALFHAERHSTGSNFDLTLTGFVSTKSVCSSVCGDGIVTPNEFCDDGTLNGGAGYCFTDCTGRAAKYAATAKYWRDYTALATCNVPPERPLWGALNWSGDSSTGGSITFQLQGSETATGLATATPVSVTVPANVTSGTFDVRTALSNGGVQADPPYLRVTAVLTSTTDQKNTPILRQYDVALTCVNVE
jgi:fibro-slime domain-containing protein